MTTNKNLCHTDLQHSTTAKKHHPFKNRITVRSKNDTGFRQNFKPSAAQLILTHLDGSACLVPHRMLIEHRNEWMTQLEKRFFNNSIRWIPLINWSTWPMISKLRNDISVKFTANRTARVIVCALKSFTSRTKQDEFTFKFTRSDKLFASNYVFFRKNSFLRKKIKQINLFSQQFLYFEYFDIKTPAHDFR